MHQFTLKMAFFVADYTSNTGDVTANILHRNVILKTCLITKV